MLKTRFILFCDYAIIAQDQKLSIIGEFSRVYTANQTASLSRCFLVASLTGEASEKTDVEIAISSKDGKDILFKRNLGIELGPEGQANLVLELNGLNFQKFGIYKATFKHKNKPLGEALINIEKIRQSVPAEA